MDSSSSALFTHQSHPGIWSLGLRVPLVAVPCALHTVFEEGADKVDGDLGLAQHIIRILLWGLWRRLFVVQRRLSRVVTVASAILIASVVGSPGPLLVRRGLAAAVRAPRTTIPTQMLLLKLLGKAVGSVVETASIGGLQVALLSLVLSLLVGVHEIAIAIAIAVAIAILLLCTPDFLLVDGLWEGRWRSGEGTAFVLELLAVTAAEAKGKVEAVALLRLLLVVHLGQALVGVEEPGSGVLRWRWFWRPSGVDVAAKDVCRRN